MNRLRFDESRLQWMGISPIAQPFERRDGFAFDRGKRRNAGSHGNAVEQYGARTALCQTAAEFGPVHFEIIAQRLE